MRAKTILILTIIYFFINNIFLFSLTISENYVSGIWKKENNPYIIEKDIEIEKNKFLIIKPGVQIYFNENKGLIVPKDTQLIAKGTQEDPIIFQGKDYAEWETIQFLNSANDDTLAFCEISHEAIDNNYSEYFYDVWGTISVKNTDLYLENVYLHNNPCGGVYADSSKIQLIDSQIIKNYYMGDGPEGGGFSAQNSNVRIINSKFFENGAIEGGALYLDNSEFTIENSIFKENGGDYGAGGLYINNSKGILISSAIDSNSTYGARNCGYVGGLLSKKSNITLKKCVIKDNIAQRFASGIGAEDSSTVIIDNCEMEREDVNNDFDSKIIWKTDIAPNYKNILKGELSGILEKKEEPYYVLNDISITDSLIIKPGVELILKNYSAIHIENNAYLKAVGTMQDSIIFTSDNVNELWNALQFRNTDKSNILEYCRISNSKFSKGGGLYSENANISIKNCLFVNNNAKYGGAIYLDNSNANFKSNKIEKNISVVHGGGIYIENSIINMIKNYLAGNICGEYDYDHDYYSGDGGGIFVKNTKINFSDNILTANGSSCGFYFIDSDINFNGNEVYNHEFGLGGWIENCTGLFSKNLIFRNTKWGGLKIIGCDSLNFLNNKFNSNEGMITWNESFGFNSFGGLSIDNSKMKIYNSLIANNVAYDGDGITTTGVQLSSSNVTFINCTIANNFSREEKSATIYIDDSKVEFINSIIQANNKEDNLFYYSLEDEEFVDYPSFINCNLSASVDSIDFIYFGDGTDEKSIKNQGEISNCQIGDPEFENPFIITKENYNDETPKEWDKISYKLKNNSPCINAGSNDIEKLPSKDIEGNPRIIDDKIDIGAYETQK